MKLFGFKDENLIVNVYVARKKDKFFVKDIPDLLIISDGKRNNRTIRGYSFLIIARPVKDMGDKKKLSMKLFIPPNIKVEQIEEIIERIKDKRCNRICEEYSIKTLQKIISEVR